MLGPRCHEWLGRSSLPRRRGSSSNRAAFRRRVQTIALGQERQPAGRASLRSWCRSCVDPAARPDRLRLPHRRNRWPEAGKHRCASLATSRSLDHGRPDACFCAGAGMGGHGAGVAPVSESGRPTRGLGATSCVLRGAGVTAACASRSCSPFGDQERCRGVGGTATGCSRCFDPAVGFIGVVPRVLTELTTASSERGVEPGHVRLGCPSR